MDPNTEYRHKARRYRVLTCAKVVRVIGVVVPVLGLIYAIVVLAAPEYDEGVSWAIVLRAVRALFAVVVFCVACFVAASVMETLADVEESMRHSARAPEREGTADTASN